MMKLYWAPRSRSFTALWLMEETGQPYERVLTDITTGAQKTPEYLAINPMGKVPALGDGDATLAEAAAICAYVAERYPEAKLAPPLGDPMRAKYLYWLFFSPGCIEPAIVQLATRIEMNPVAAGWGEAQRVFDVLDKAVEKARGFSATPSRPRISSSGRDSITRCGCSRWCRRVRRSTPISIAAPRGRRSSARRNCRRDDFVGWAKAHLRRAHHINRTIRWNGGHAAKARLCPPYENYSPRFFSSSGRGIEMTL